MTQNENASEILAPPREITTPQIPPEFEIGVHGLAVPRGKTSSLTVLRLNKPRILTLEEKPAQILVPPTEEVSQLSSVQEEEDDHHQALIFYLTDPWNYFDQHFQDCHLTSPIKEIKQQILNARNKLPILTEESKILLRSPFKYVRETEERKLLLQGIDKQTIADCLLPDISFVKPAQLDFTQSETAENSLETFYQILQKSIEEIMFVNTNLTEQLQHLSKFSHYLSIISETYMYRLSIFKMDNPLLLEKIAQKIEFLTTQKLTTTQANYLRNFFDFIAHFVMNNRNASSVFLEILNSANFHHPLKHELNYQLNPDQMIDKSQPRVGIEIEGVPLIAYASLNGFDLGIDGGGTMPEFRRSVEELHFDGHFKKQLFEFWYWAKMTQFKGASLHIHLDDPDYRNLETFHKILGPDIDSVRGARKIVDTVELRFNLTGYAIDENNHATFNLSVPFFDQQYDLVQFIEILLKIGENADFHLLAAELLELPSFWQLRLTKITELIDFNQLIEFCDTAEWDDAITYSTLSNFIGCLNYEQVLMLLKKKKWNYGVMISALKKLSTSLDLEQVIELGNITAWDWDVVFIALNKLKSPLSIEQIFEFSKRFEWNLSLTLASLEHLIGNISFEEIVELGEKTEWNWRIIYKALNELDTSLSWDQVLEIGENTEWEANVSHVALNHLASNLSFKQILIFSQKYHWNANVIGTALGKLDNPLSLEEFVELCKKFKWQAGVIYVALNHLANYSNFELILDLSQKYHWNYGFLEKALRKLDAPLNFEQVLQIGRNVDWDSRIIDKILDKLSTFLSFEQVLQIGHNVDWNLTIFSKALDKLTTSLNFEQVLQIGRNVDWDSRIIDKILDKLSTSLSLEQFIELCEKAQWKWFFINMLFKRGKNILKSVEIMAEVNEAFIAKIMLKIPPEKKLLLWSLFSTINLQRPARINQVI